MSEVLETQEGIYVKADIVPGYQGIWLFETDDGATGDLVAFDWMKITDILSACGPSRVKQDE